MCKNPAVLLTMHRLQVQLAATPGYGITHAMRATVAPHILPQVRAVYGDNPSIFHTAGPEARRLATLGWVMIVVGVAVFIIVMLLLLIPLWRRRNATQDDARPAPVNERAWVLYGGAAIPAVILAGIFVLTLATMRDSLAARPTPLTIEVTGHRWWWEVRYPQQRIHSADEIHLPVGRAVKVILKSSDVIHSFWIPNLAGKTDAIPGSTNAMWLQADRAGIWRGQCAGYCGVQHAHMALSVIAQPADAFARWVATEQGDARAPNSQDATEGAHAFV
jgi:cytochrome c oxidase subunit 2